MLPRRKKRVFNILLMFGATAIGVYLILFALDSKLDFFYKPSELNFNELPNNRIKIGGLVKQASIERKGTRTYFRLIDFSRNNNAEVAVMYDRVPPDLFKENSGAVVLGGFNDNQVFVAEELYAKHDENYRPREVTSE
tara:strand:+ start:276 stop:689 length:414 start_codon:yes stop_codon:yes gene_type:complete